MTTIAWDGKTLAADRRINYGTSRYRFACKIFAVDGGHVACAGNQADITAFLRWYREGCTAKPPALTNFGALMVVHGQVIDWHGGERIDMDNDVPVAIGSGWRWAAAAMDFGCTAAEAIEYAATRDNYTGGGVDSVAINAVRKRAAKGKT